MAALAAARRTDTAFDRMLHQTNEPDLSVHPQSILEAADLDPTLLDAVMRIDGVEGVSEVALMAVSVAQYPSFYSVAFVDQRGDAFRPIYVEGSARNRVADMAANELLINESMRDVLGQGVGATLQLESATSDQFVAAFADNGELSSPLGPTPTAGVVGVYRTPEDVSDAPDPFLVFSSAFYDLYHDEMWTCRCLVQIKAEPGAVDAVAAELAVIYPDAVIDRREDFAGRLADTVALQQRAWQFMALAAALAGLATLFFACSRVAQSLLIGDEACQAIGMTRRNRQLGRLLTLMPIVVLGTLGAAGFAYALSPIAPVGITRRAEPTPGLLWDPAVSVPGIAGVLLVSLLLVAIASAMVRPRAKELRDALHLGGPVTSLGTRLALGPGRIGIVGVFFAATGWVGALTLDQSIQHTLTTPSAFGSNFDAKIDVFGIDEQVIIDKLSIDPDIEAVGVESSELVTEVPVRVVGPAGSATVEPLAVTSVKGTIPLQSTDGRAPSQANEVALGRKVMEAIGANIGDRVMVTAARGSSEFTIVGALLRAGTDDTGSGFEVTLDGLGQLVEPGVSGIEVRFADSADREAVIDHYSNYELAPVQPPSEVRNVGELGGLPRRVGQLLIALGIAALINAVVVTVAIGRRQIAIHRALGFTSAQVVRVHVWQFLITVAVGGLVGGLAGFIVGRAIHRQLVTNVGAIAQVVLPTNLWVVVSAGIIVSLIAGAISSALALHRRPGAVLRAE